MATPQDPVVPRTAEQAYALELLGQIDQLLGALPWAEHAGFRRAVPGAALSLDDIVFNLQRYHEVLAARIDEWRADQAELERWQRAGTGLRDLLVLVGFGALTEPPAEPQPQAFTQAHGQPFPAPLGQLPPGQPQ